MLYQSQRFIQAVDEFNNTKISENEIGVDHKNMTITHGNRMYRLIFPKSYVEQINKIGFKKDIEYNFVGLYTNKREWVNEYIDSKDNIINFNRSGRTKEKGYFDIEYYKTLCRSKYTLCPEGDHKWTYRFYEAILCKSIPITKTRSEFYDYARYLYYTKDCDHQYDESFVDHNYDVFLNSHILSK